MKNANVFASTLHLDKHDALMSIRTQMISKVEKSYQLNGTSNKTHLTHFEEKRFLSYTVP